MKLTCVTAVFNVIKSGNREGLIRCVQSIAALKTEHEHLIYDGASTDGTVELLRDLEGKTPGLNVVSEKDAGIFNALNKGLRDAKGVWFYVLGADDYVFDPGVMDETISETPGCVDIIASTVRMSTGALAFDSMRELRKIFMTLPYSHQGVIMRTALGRKLGGFDEHYKPCADYNMLLKAHKSCCRFRYVFKPYAFFQRGGLSCQDSSLAYIAEVVRDNFGFADAQARNHRSEKSLPIHKLLPWAFHGDRAIRMGARWMMRRRIKHFARLAFYPLVVVTRPLRYRG